MDVNVTIIVGIVLVVHAVPNVEVIAPFLKGGI
jgi:hypothetical protein